MKKIFLNIIGALLLISFAIPQITSAQKLPTPYDLEYKGYQIVILEESLGNVQGLKEAHKKAFKEPLFRKTECTVNNNNRDNCITAPHLVFECQAKDWTVKNQKSIRQPGAQKTTCDRVSVVIGRGGLEILKNYIATIYRWGASIIGIIAVFQITLAGIRISISQGGDQMTQGKDTIIQALLSIVILFLSALILYTANPNFFV